MYIILNRDGLMFSLLFKSQQSALEYFINHIKKESISSYIVTNGNNDTLFKRKGITLVKRDPELITINYMTIHS